MKKVLVAIAFLFSAVYGQDDYDTSPDGITENSLKKSKLQKEHFELKQEASRYKLENSKSRLMQEQAANKKGDLKQAYWSNMYNSVDAKREGHVWEKKYEKSKQEGAQLASEQQAEFNGAKAARDSADKEKGKEISLENRKAQDDSLGRQADAKAQQAALDANNAGLKEAAYSTKATTDGAVARADAQQANTFVQREKELSGELRDVNKDYTRQAEKVNSETVAQEKIDAKEGSLRQSYNQEERAVASNGQNAASLSAAANSAKAEVRSAERTEKKELGKALVEQEVAAAAKTDLKNTESSVARVNGRVEKDGRELERLEKAKSADEKVAAQESAQADGFQKSLQRARQEDAKLVAEKTELKAKVAADSDSAAAASVKVITEKGIVESAEKSKQQAEEKIRATETKIASATNAELAAKKKEQQESRIGDKDRSKDASDSQALEGLKAQRRDLERQAQEASDPQVRVNANNKIASLDMKINDKRQDESNMQSAANSASNSALQAEATVEKEKERIDDLRATEQNDRQKVNRNQRTESEAKAALSAAREKESAKETESKTSEAKLAQVKLEEKAVKTKESKLRLQEVNARNAGMSASNAAKRADDREIPASGNLLADKTRLASLNSERDAENSKVASATAQEASNKARADAAAQEVRQALSKESADLQGAANANKAENRAKARAQSDQSALQSTENAAAQNAQDLARAKSKESTDANNSQLIANSVRSEASQATAASQDAVSASIRSNNEAKKAADEDVARRKLSSKERSEESIVKDKRQDAAKAGSKALDAELSATSFDDAKKAKLAGAEALAVVTQSADKGAQVDLLHGMKSEQKAAQYAAASDESLRKYEEEARKQAGYFQKTKDSELATSQAEYKAARIQNKINKFQGNPQGVEDTDQLLQDNLFK